MKFRNNQRTSLDNDEIYHISGTLRKGAPEVPNQTPGKDGRKVQGRLLLLILVIYAETVECFSDDEILLSLVMFLPALLVAHALAKPSPTIFGIPYWSIVPPYESEIETPQGKKRRRRHAKYITYDYMIPLYVSFYYANIDVFWSFSARASERKYIALGISILSAFSTDYWRFPRISDGSRGWQYILFRQLYLSASVLGTIFLAMQPSLLIDGFWNGTLEQLWLSVILLHILYMWFASYDISPQYLWKPSRLLKEKPPKVSFLENEELYLPDIETLNRDWSEDDEIIRVEFSDLYSSKRKDNVRAFLSHGLQEKTRKTLHDVGGSHFDRMQRGDTGFITSPSDKDELTDDFTADPKNPGAKSLNRRYLHRSWHESLQDTFSGSIGASARSVGGLLWIVFLLEFHLHVLYILLRFLMILLGKDSYRDGQYGKGWQGMLHFIVYGLWSLHVWGAMALIGKEGPIGYWMRLARWW